MLQLHDLPPQPDVHRHQDLFDRTEPVELMRPRIARPVDHFIGRKQPPGPPMNNLFIGRRWWARPAPSNIDQELDRVAGDGIEPDYLPIALLADLKGRSIDDHNVL